MTQKRKNAIVCIIIVLLIVIAIIYLYVKNSDIKSILLGVISSIIASSIFYIFSEVIFETKTEEVQVLRQTISAIESIKTSGIIDIKGRSEFESDFWIEFAQTTDKMWTISGRTLNRWLGNGIKESFRKNILRLLKGGAEINFIIYKNLDGEEQREKEQLHDFLNREIFPSCVKKEKNEYVKKENAKLKIFEVDSLPYLYNANENKIIVAPYFNYVENSSNIMFILRSTHKHGEEYSRDFLHVMLSADENTWLDDYLKERNKGCENDNAM